MTGRILFVSGSGGSGTLRYRVRFAEEALRASGFETAAVHFTDPLLRSWLSGADVLALYRTPATRRLLAAVSAAKLEHRIPVTFDVDDLVFRPEHLASIPFLADLPARRRRLFELDATRRGIAAQFADRTSGATGPIVAELVELTGAPSRQLPNGIGRISLGLANQAHRTRERRDRVRLGYFSGSATHDADWAQIEPAVVRVLTELPETELLLVGQVAVGSALAAFGPRVQRRQVVPWQELFELLAAVDVNLAPLAAGRFAWGKSAIKWLEAAVVATPTVATASPAFAESIVDGATGRLVAPGGEWLEPISELVVDARLRHEVGERARLAALRDYGPDVQAERYADWFGSVIAAGTGPAEPERVRSALRDADRTITLGVTLERHPFDEGLPRSDWAPPRGDRELLRAREGIRRARRLAVAPVKAVARRRAAARKPGRASGR